MDSYIKYMAFPLYYNIYWGPMTTYSFFPSVSSIYDTSPMTFSTPVYMQILGILFIIESRGCLKLLAEHTSLRRVCIPRFTIVATS